MHISQISFIHYKLGNQISDLKHSNIEDACKQVKQDNTLVEAVVI